MKTLLAITGAILIGAMSQAMSATIPAGTILTVKTLQTVSSVDPPGTSVPMQLQCPLAANNKLILPTGTYFNAKVITSRRLTVTRDRLSVNLTSMRVAGRDIPLTTTGPQLLSNYIKASGDVKVSLAYDVVAAGKQMRFQLAQPVVW